MTRLGLGSWRGILFLFLGAFLPGAEVSGQGAEAYPHGTFPEGLGCLDCHTTEGWKPIQEDPEFNHGQVTGFPLVGQHAAASCLSCHEDLHFEKAAASPEECGTCHVDVHSGSLASNCSLCHTPTSFKDISGLRIHQTTGFPLQGAHLQLSCESCHSDDVGGAFSPLPTDCLACHTEDYESPKSVDHVALGFPAECLVCHTPQSWLDIGSFDHAEFSGGYQLRGAHQNAQCSSCHLPGGGLLFDPQSEQDCVACHQADYQEEHAGSGYPTSCLLCHGQGTWDTESFDHAQVSGGYQLDGAHEELACTNCHTPDGGSTIFNPTDQTDCVSCHQGDYQEEHAGSGYPTTCLDCHTVETWDGATTDHVALSGGFELIGDHGTLACTSCHTPDGNGTLFSPTSADDCVACHSADFQQEHSGSGYPETCLTCHQVTTWDGAETDHTVFSEGFGLLGDHGLLPCTSCHVPGGSETLFDPTTPEDCVACHQTDYQQQHTGSGYPTTCLTCHTINTWDGASVDHAAVSGGFALPTDHEGLDCTSCHTPDGSGTLFSPTSADDCVACHSADFQREHSGSGYPTDCSVCHVTTNWDGATAEHTALSGGFGLLGDHGLLPCTSCHIPGGTETLFDPTTPEDCVACHQTDYQQQHSGSGYPTSCLTCHTINTWGGAVVDHAAVSGGFDLVGNHGLLACTSCHLPGGTETLFDPSSPEDCVACHQGDFQREHSGSGYPTSCLSCHVVTTWGGAQFNHDADFFPIYSGKHEGKWGSCQTCHSSPDDYTIFSCLNCHEHNKNDTDRDHSEVQGYAYASGQCLSCHPTGKS